MCVCVYVYVHVSCKLIIVSLIILPDQNYVDM